MIFILILALISLQFSFKVEVKCSFNFPFKLIDEVDYKVKASQLSIDRWEIEIWQDLRYSPVAREYEFVLNETLKVKEILDYDPYEWNENFEEILRKKRGNCISFVSFLKEKLKKTGFITEEIHGILFSKENTNPFYIEKLNATPHRWIRVFFKDFGWISFDPLSKNGRVTKFHLPLKGIDCIEFLKKIDLKVIKWD